MELLLSAVIEVDIAVPTIPDMPSQVYLRVPLEGHCVGRNAILVSRFELRGLGMSERIFSDRRSAGKELAKSLKGILEARDGVVIGLPRGGVPVAYEVAVALSLPLEILVIRKLGAPGHAELAIGAVGGGGVRVLNRRIIESLGIAEEALEKIADEQRRRVEQLFEDHGFLKNVDGRDVYFHRNAVLHGDFDRLAVGTGVNYMEEMGEDGLQASTVRIVDKPGAREEAE